MGCGASKETDEQWRIRTERLEKECMSQIGWKEGTYTVKYTQFEMDNQPFQARTWYFGCEDKSKKTLILTHGFMANIPSLLTFTNIMAKHYRVIAFDNCNWGLNTRTPESAAINKMQKDPGACEKWMLECYEKIVDNLDDCPDQFFLAGHSMGGYQSALYASQHPEKIEKLFLISPGGMTHYDPATFDKLKTNMMHGDEPWRRYTLKDIQAGDKAD